MNVCRFLLSYPALVCNCGDPWCQTQGCLTLCGAVCTLSISSVEVCAGYERTWFLQHWIRCVLTSFLGCMTAVLKIVAADPLEHCSQAGMSLLSFLRATGAIGITPSDFEMLVSGSHNSSQQPCSILILPNNTFRS